MRIAMTNGATAPTVILTVREKRHRLSIVSLSPHSWQAGLTTSEFSKQAESES